MIFLVWLLPLFLGFLPHKMPGQEGVNRPQVTVYIFLSETCPICQITTLEIRRIGNEFPKVQFIGMFPGKDSDLHSRKKFAKKYHLNFPLQGDSLRQLTQLFKATITPEVVVVGVDKEILYRGKIDNSFLAPGKKRAVTTEKYLYNALKAIHLGQIPNPASTEPVGCFIE